MKVFKEFSGKIKLNLSVCYREGNENKVWFVELLKESISNTVPAPSLSAVNNQKLFFGQWGAVNTQERLILKDYFSTN